MDQPGRVRPRERAGHLTEHGDGLLRREAPLSRETLLEVLPLEQLHRDERHLPAHAVVEHLDDVWAANLRRRHRLALEARADRLVRGDLRAHELHGARDVEREVLREPHRPHPPDAERADQAEAIGDDGVGLELQGSGVAIGGIRCALGRHRARLQQLAIHPARRPAGAARRRVERSSRRSQTRRPVSSWAMSTASPRAPMLQTSVEFERGMPS
jgi:hypothetical protein